ncbi:MAG: exodeoxyribonuclease V subunit gamma [Succinivibrio sp.]|nr:exodeoxyribonuclease V subunit gamma [Succinivibrio sp.]
MSRQRQFTVLNSNDVEVLSEICAQIIREHPLQDPLAAEQVIVMNFGMGKYFNQTLARHCGIAAQCEFMPLWKFIWFTHKKVQGIDDPENRFNRLHIMWSLMSTVTWWGTEQRPELCRILHEYLKGSEDSGRLYELSLRIADCFDQYQMYRPDWIERWNRLKREDFELYTQNPAYEGAVKRYLDDLSGKDPYLRHVLENNLWQPLLWSTLRGNLKTVTSGSEAEESRRAAVAARWDRSEVIAELMKALEGPSELSCTLPERVFIVGVSAMPPQVLRFFAAYASRAQVYLLFLNPCREYWGDLKSSWAGDFKRFESFHSELSRRSRCFAGALQTTEGRGKVVGRPEELRTDASCYDENALVEGNPLLLSLGRQGQDNLTLLMDLEPLPNFVDAFLEPEGDTLLCEIKRRLLELPVTVQERYTIKPWDRSLQVRSCHTTRREIEVLHDEILSLFAQAAQAGHKLMPREILVMMPNVEEYAADIEAVFGAINQDDARYIPYALADRSASSSSPVADAILKLLTISFRRVTASLIVELLSVPALAGHFGIAPDEVDIIAKWLGEARILWGLDDEDVNATLGQSDGRALPWTFERGVQRMVLGFMAGDGAADGTYGAVEGDDAELLGRLWKFCDCLKRLRAKFTPQLELSTAGWREALEELLLEFLDDSEDTREPCRQILEVVSELEQVGANIATAPRITLGVFYALLRDALGADTVEGSYLRGSVNFCSLVPMRAVPFKHIFVIGLNDGQFPRQERAPGFNLMTVKGFYRRGDRSRSLDDRYLFLEALLSATHSIYFSYQGRDPRDESAKNPSAVLSELLDYLSDICQVQDEKGRLVEEREAVNARLCAQERLNSYDKENYTCRGGGAALSLTPSYDKESFCQIPEQVTRTAFGCRPLCVERDFSLTPEDRVELDLDKLIWGLSSPNRLFLQRLDQIKLSADQDELLDDEDFELPYVERTALLGSLIDESLQEAQLSLELLNKQGQLPHGIFGDFTRKELLSEQHAYQEALQQPLPPQCSQKPEQLDYSHEFSLDFAGKTINVTFAGALQAPAVIRDLYSSDLSKRPRTLLRLALTACALSFSTRPQPVVVQLKDSPLQFFRMLSQDEAQSLLESCVTLYLSASLRPLPLTLNLLKKEVKDDDFLGYDEAAAYLYQDNAQLRELSQADETVQEFCGFYAAQLRDNLGDYLEAAS